ncbi:MAG: prohibitin family protein [Microcoleaceae cyanobacterium]
MINYKQDQVSPAVILGGVVVTVLGILAWNSKYIVQPGYSGVAIMLGNAQEEPMTEGLNFKAPFITSVHSVSVQPQTYSPNERIAAGSSDLQSLLSEIQVEWRVQEDRVVEFWREFRSPEAFQKRILQSIVTETYNTSAAQFTAADAVKKRTELSSQFAELVTEKTQRYPITILRATVTDIDFQPEFAKAIEQKQIAQQKAQEAAYRAEEAEQDAQAKVNLAKGEAEAARLRAKALQEQGGSLFLQQQAIEKWDGQVPTIMVTGDDTGGNFIFDLNSLPNSSK